MKKLDEMKRLKLLKIEEKSFYLIFYGLVCIIIVQAFLNGFRDIQEILLSILLVVVVSIYLVISCFKEGIWSHQDANVKKNILTSIFVGGFAAIVFGYKLSLFDRNHILHLLVIVLITSILTYFILVIVNGIYTKRIDRLENGDDE